MPCLTEQPAMPRRRLSPPDPVRSDDENIAYLLIGTWALATGRSLPRDVPLDQLSADELIDFWADPMFEQGDPRRGDAGRGGSRISERTTPMDTARSDGTPDEEGAT